MFTIIEFVRRGLKRVPPLYGAARWLYVLVAGLLGPIRTILYWRAILPAVSATELSSPKSREVVMLVVSNLRIDPRVERGARALAKAGYDVKVIFPDTSCPQIADQPIDWGGRITFRPLPWQAARYTMYALWLFGDMLHKASLLERPLAFHCHDLTTAIIGLSAAHRTGALCVCDFHEWWSENVTWNGQRSQWVPHPPFKRLVFRLAERLVLWRANAVITVCDSIAKELEQLGGKRRWVRVIRNIPLIGSTVPNGATKNLRTLIGVGDDVFILLYQGGVGPSRLLEPIIQATALVDETVLVIRGPAIEQFGNDYLNLAQALGIEKRVVCLPPVPSAEVVEAAAGADAGIWTLPNVGKNFYYALPNKVFEYLAAGLPILGANFPEVRNLIERYRVGRYFDPYDPKSIADQVNAMRRDCELMTQFRTNIPKALQRMRAGVEWEKLVKLYDELLAERENIQEC